MRTRTRIGFTLLELLLAMLLTAVAVTLAASTLRTASIAKERVTVHRTTLERESRLRAVLTDMLRHAPAAELVEEPLMRLDTPAPNDSRLVFLSKGVRAPFGTGPTWRVSLSATDVINVTAFAQQIGSDEPAFGFVRCASQNGTCRLPTGVAATVYYGANGKFNSKPAMTGSVACNNSQFGNPLPNITKACYYTR